MAVEHMSSEGFSMTPPMSPVRFQQLDEEEMDVDLPELTLSNSKPKLVQFSCLGDVHPVFMEFDQHSYLLQRSLNKLLQQHECTIPAQMFSYKLYSLFGHKVISNSCFSTIPENLFFMARQKFSILEHSGLDISLGSSFQDKTDYASLREEIVSFLNFVNAELTRLCLEEDSSGRIIVLKHLRNFLMHIGRLSNLPSHVLTNCMRGNTSTSASYHLFHLHLDVMWSFIQIFYILQVKEAGNCPISFIDTTYGAPTSCNLLSEYLSVVLWDLVIVALRRFKKISLHNYKATSPFSCTCVRELWVLLINVADDAQEQKNGDSFWITMKPVFDSVLNEKVADSQQPKEKNSDTFQAEPEFDCENRPGFGWWMMMHLSALYQIDIPDVKCVTKAHMSSNYSLINNLITRSLQHLKLVCRIQLIRLVCLSAPANATNGTPFSSLAPAISSYLNKNRLHFHLCSDLPSWKTLGLCGDIIAHLNREPYPMTPLSSESIEEALEEYWSQTRVPTADEAHLRCYMQCCVSTCQIWEPCTDILSPLWNHFFKNLNSSFCLPHSLEGLQTLPSSGAKWLQQLKNRLSDGAISSATSYELFLCLVQLQLGRGGHTDGTMQDWKQFKGRLYAKFHPRKMNDLNDLGIQNFISLFLTMAAIADFEDVVTRLCDLLDMIPFASLSNKQLSTMWCGLFAIMNLAQEKNTAVNFVAQKLAAGFNNICQTMSQEKLEPRERHEKLKLVVLYIKGLQELVENSQNLNSAEHFLIAPGFNVLLPSCKTDEMHLALSVVQMLITKQRIIFRRSTQVEFAANLPHHKELTKALWSNILPFIKEHSKTVTPPHILAEIAAALTFAASDLHDQMLGMPSVETRGSLFKLFGLSSDINPELCCHYLCSLLTQQDMAEKFMAEIKDFQPLLICSWFRCTAILLPANDLLQQLTRLVAKLPEINSLLSDAGFYASDTEDVLWIQFCKALRAKFSSLQNLCDKIAFRQRVEFYFSDVMKAVATILKNFGPTDQLRNVYQVLGELFKQCAPLLYIKSKADGLLHDIMNRMILQRIIYKYDTPIPPILQAVLRDTLKMFVAGLLALNPRRDPCINNRLKDIVVHYTLRFSPKTGYNGGYTLHPLLESLSEALPADAPDQAKDFLSFVLEVIRDHFFSRRLQFTSSQLLSVTYLVTGLLEESLDETRVIISQVLLMPSLQILLLTDDPNLKQSLRNAVKLMVESCKRSEETIPKSTWVPMVKDFIVRHISSYGNNLFKLLELLAIWYPALVKEMVPTITNCIHAAEEKRGVGQDRVLRQGQCRLLQRLGIQVQEGAMNKH